jgi:signal transduction histidine kinase
MTDRSASILLVDDEAGIRTVLGVFLEDLGYAVHTAESAEQAIALFRTHAPPLVLTDIRMPGRDGIDLLREIKAENPETEVIMITGHGDMELAIRSLQLEAADFVTKPIRNEVLEIALKRAEERIALRRQLREYTENLERMVAEKTQKLVAAERMSAIGQTVAGLSHTIKNIAGGLSGGAFVLEKGLSMDNRTYLSQGWDMVKRNVEKITSLSMALLNYSKTAEVSMVPCDPNEPVREALRLMTGRAQAAGVALAATLDPRLEPVCLDSESIQICLINLLENAIDACVQEGAGGKAVEIRTGPVHGWGVEYRITDDGCGMNPEIRSKIFQNFFTTKGSRGTGMGLMIAGKTVDAHGGEIEVDSRSGQGTTVTVRLPERREEKDEH